MTTDPSPARALLAFLVAVIVATVWGSVVQTQYNLAALSAIGTDIPAGVWAAATARDVFSGFSPTYAGYFVVPSLLVAFLVAWLIVRRGAGGPLLWFTLAGLAAIAVAIPLVNWLSPLALVIGAARDVSAIVLMAAGGAVAGAVFALIAYADMRHRRVTDRPPVSTPAR